MYQLVFGGKFFHSAKNLDKKLKPRLKFGLDILSKNPFHPTLRTKPLIGKLSGCYSFRLGRDYRVIFKILSASLIFLFDIGHRKDIYR